MQLFKATVKNSRVPFFKVPRAELRYVECIQLYPEQQSLILLGKLDFQIHCPAKEVKLIKLCLPVSGCRT